MKVILLIGPPGSGKTTTALKHFPKYHRISQDDLGSRDLCIKEMKEVLRKNLDVIVDRCNMTKSQRSFWINVAKEYGTESIIGIVLEVPEEECVARIYERKNHPTIPVNMSLSEKKRIIYQFNESYQIPLLSEGFSSIIITRN